MNALDYALKADGSINHVGDGTCRTDIYCSTQLHQWVVVDLVNQNVGLHDRLAAYTAKNVDPEECGLNQTCVACDLEGIGVWYLPLDADDDATPDHQDVELLWDSAT